MEKKHEPLKKAFCHILRKKIPLILAMVMVFSMLPADLSAGLGLTNQAEAAVSLAHDPGASEAMREAQRQNTHADAAKRVLDYAAEHL